MSRALRSTTNSARRGKEDNAQGAVGRDCIFVREAMLKRASAQEGLAGARISIQSAKDMS